LDDADDALTGPEQVDENTGRIIAMNERDKTDTRRSSQRARIDNFSEGAPRSPHVRERVSDAAGEAAVIDNGMAEVLQAEGEIEREARTQPQGACLPTRTEHENASAGQAGLEPGRTALASSASGVSLAPSATSFAAPRKADKDSAAIVFENVSYTYPDGNPALRGLSFTVRQGTTTCVIGPNGAGKSTLLLALLGFLDVDGVITVNGVRVSKETARDIRARVGLVFQDPDDQLFMPSVFEDVAFGPRNFLSDDEAHRAAAEALEQVGLRGFERRLAHHLSFGEKKRVAIAGVLAMKPEIIALDEPTSNLDHLHRRRLIEILDRMSATLLIATHDLYFAAEIADDIVVIKDGQAIAQGPAVDILSDGDLLARAHLEAPCQCAFEQRGARRAGRS
jgi:cobalt/nickel transport system ATP-binding protein